VSKAQQAAQKVDEVEVPVEHVWAIGPQRPIARDHAAVLEAVKRVAAKTVPRAAEIDEARAFPRDLFNELADTGVFWATAPRDHDGLEMPIDVMNEIVFACARANGSLGWLMMVGSSQGTGHGLSSKQAMEEMKAVSPYPRNRGLIALKGVAVPVEGGYMVSGRWPFATGGPDPHFVTGNCIVLRDGKPSISAEGVPEAIMALLPASEAIFHDNWYVLGMRGTDSCDVEFRDAFVPEHRAFNFFTVKNKFDVLPARMPTRIVLSFGHTAMACGIAQGAIDDLLELAKTKRSSMNPTRKMSDEPVFRHMLGEHTLRLEACKGMLNGYTAQAWALAGERREFTPQQILIGRTMSAYVTAECVKIVDWAYTAAGSSSVYDTSSLQRRFRDIHVATQHASCHTEGYGVLGGILLGEQVSPMELF
jgi:alkylation response protein AidB-like acyl-CoA dehydrogenase